MSIENNPVNDDLDELILQCEQAIEDEGLVDKDEEIDDFYQLRSAQICEQIRQVFEHRNHLVYLPNSLYSDDKSPFLSEIRLYKPTLLLPSVLAGSVDLELELDSEVTLPYLSVVLYQSTTNNSQPYIGPHFFGIIDTGSLGVPIPTVRPGEYRFLSQLRNLVIPEKYRPSAFN